MKKILLFIIFINFAHAKEWKLTPQFYSRGGITLDQMESKKATSNTVFNLGAWNGESNAIRDNLTEISIEARFKDSFKYTYGIDVNNNNRYYDTAFTSLNERLNFMEFYHNNLSLWFGSRAYRGDGDHLFLNWALDEHNLLGGGVRIEKAGPFNLEFAYGVKKNPSNTLHTTINILINKIEFPLTNGKIKSNIEIHKVNDFDSQYSSLAFLTGAQYQRWGDKFLEGSLYNIFVLNYSRGFIYQGTMQSIFNTNDKDNPASKLLAKWGGDWKAKDWGLYYVFQSQRHMGQSPNSIWTYFDLNLRPVYGISENITLGLDFLQRINLENKNLETISWYANSKWQIYNATRGAIMVAYNLKNEMFSGPTARLFFGRMISKYERDYFTDKTAKQSNFVRFDYEISF